VIRFSAHLSMLYRHLPEAERPAAARADGYEVVESWWPAEPDAFGEAVGEAGVAVACLNSYAGDLTRGERGFLNVEERGTQTLFEFIQAVELARRLRAGAVNVLVGRALPDVPLARQRAVAVAALRDLAHAAPDVTIVVEPLNELDVPGSLVPTPRDAVALLEEVGAPTVRLLYDAYHAARAGSDPLVEAPALVDWIGHVQYADAPGRGAPGTGTIDLARLVEALDGAGYAGAIGLEYEGGTG
jgi:hydroxypyruvate isomerase